MIPEIREASWTAPVPWRFASNSECPPDFRLNFQASEGLVYALSGNQN
jgi:hypothetical protein